mgnify:CR=1 FL=1
MSFVVKNSQLTNEVIQVLNQFIEIDIDASAAFRLSRIIKDLSSIIEDKSKAEKKIFDKWAQKDESGNFVLAKTESGEIIENSVVLLDANEFNSEMESLLNIENTINYEKLNFDDLKLKSAKIKDILKVEFLFV